MLNLKLDTRVGLQMGKISKSAQSDQSSICYGGLAKFIESDRNGQVVRTFLLLHDWSPTTDHSKSRLIDGRRPSSIV